MAKLSCYLCIFQDAQINISDLQRAQIEWAKKRQERLDYINNQIMKQRKAEKRLVDLNSAMQQYFIVTGRQLEPLPPKPVLSDFYVLSEEHHNQELAFITLSMVGIGAFLWYPDKYIIHNIIICLFTLEMIWKIGWKC